MLENIRGHSRGSIRPLRMSSPLPHDLCHEWNVSRRLPARGGFLLTLTVQADAMKPRFGWPVPQDTSVSEWVGRISLQSKGLSRVFSNTTVQKHQFFGARVRHSAHGKGHEEGGSTYAKAGSSLGSAPGYSRALQLRKQSDPGCASGASSGQPMARTATSPGQETGVTGLTGDTKAGEARGPIV